MILRIKEILKEKKMTQVELADKLGISKVGMNFIVNNKTSPSIQIVEKIAEILKVSIYDILGKKDERPQTFSAIINNNGKAFEVFSVEELKAFAASL